MRFLPAVFLLLLFQNLCAQDKITLNKGEEINVKVVSIDSSKVKYKKLDDPTFTTLTMDGILVKKVVYENGKTVRFNNRPKSYIAFHLGTSFGSGDHGLMEPTNIKSGYATTGLTASLGGVYYFAKNFGIGVHLGSFSNDYENLLLESQFSGLFPNGEEPVVSFGDWNVGYGAASLSYSIKLHHRITWDNLLYLGRMNASKPSIDFSQADALGNTFIYVSGTGSGQRVMTGFHTQLRVHLTKHWGAGVGLQYLYSSLIIGYTDTLEFYDTNQNLILGREFEGQQAYNIEVGNFLFNINYNF